MTNRDTDRTHTTRQVGNGISRRRILQAVGAGTAISGTSKIVGASDEPTEEIVVELREGEPSRTEEVPRRWWQHVEKVKRLRKQMREERANDRAINGFGIGLGKDNLAGRNKRRLIAQVQPGETPDVALSTTVEDVQVTVEEIPAADEMELDSCNPDSHCDTETHEDLPGGANIRNPESNQGFSACAKVNDGDDEMLLTCAHSYIDDGTCDGDEESTSTYAGSDEEYIGFRSSSYELDRHRDLAFIEMSSVSDVGLVPQVKNGENSTINVSGIMTEDGLISRQGSEVYKYGARNCLESGEMQDLLDDGVCSGPDENWVRIDGACRGGGDSGGPYFDTWSSGSCPEHATLMGIHRGSPSGTPDDVSYGCAAHVIDDAYDSISFATQTTCIS